MTDEGQAMSDAARLPQQNAKNAKAGPLTPCALSCGHVRRLLAAPRSPLLAICATPTTYEGTRMISETASAKPLPARVYGGRRRCATPAAKRKGRCALRI